MSTPERKPATLRIRSLLAKCPYDRYEHTRIALMRFPVSDLQTYCRDSGLAVTAPRKEVFVSRILAAANCHENVKLIEPVRVAAPLTYVPVPTPTQGPANIFGRGCLLTDETRPEAAWCFDTPEDAARAQYGPGEQCRFLDHMSEPQVIQFARELGLTEQRYYELGGDLNLVKSLLGAELRKGRVRSCSYLKNTS
jgi:hypothetical protein